MIHVEDQCDACGKGFLVEHGLGCKTGGLIGLSHNDNRDKVRGLPEAALLIEDLSLVQT